MQKRAACLLIGLIFICQSPTHAWVTRKNFEKNMETWLGRDADELIPRWGTPTSEYKLSSGGRVLTFLKATGVHSRMMPSLYGYAYLNSPLECKVSFTVDAANIIQQWSAEGNNCRSWRCQYKSAASVRRFSVEKVHKFP